MRTWQAVSSARRIEGKDDELQPELHFTTRPDAAFPPASPCVVDARMKTREPKRSGDVHRRLKTIENCRVRSEPGRELSSIDAGPEPASMADRQPGISGKATGRYPFWFDNDQPRCDKGAL